MRIAPVAALVGSLLVPSPAPAADVVSGTAEIECYGCGPSYATASFTVGSRGVARAQFTFVTGPGPDCTLSSTASGSVSGALTGAFNWVQSGRTMTITISGGQPYTAVTTYQIVGDVGSSPCGRRATVSFTGVGQ